MGLAKSDLAEPAIIRWHLLLDDVGLNGHAEMIRLTRQVSSRMIVGAVVLEATVSSVAPENREQSETVRLFKRLRDLNELTVTVFAAEINRRADADSAHIEGLLHTAKRDLLVGLWVGHQLVMVQLYDVWNAMGIFAGGRCQHTQRRCNAAASRLDGKLHDLSRVEINRVWRKRSTRSVLDPGPPVEWRGSHCRQVGPYSTSFVSYA